MKRTERENLPICFRALFDTRVYAKSSAEMGGKMYKILIIEDDEVISQTIKEHLSQWGYLAKEVDDFQRVMEIFVDFNPHFVLLDISLPFYNGYHWCSEIRKISRVPIVFLSSASDNMNIVMTMNMGGDDFIAKPFDLHVLVAKVQALLRRTYSFQEKINVLECGGVLLNLGEAALSYQNETLDLTKNDFKILQILFEKKGNVVSREEIMKRLWESDSYIDDNTLTVNVTRIRKKLESIGLEQFIKTKKGIGYFISGK